MKRFRNILLSIVVTCFSIGCSSTCIEEKNTLTKDRKMDEISEKSLAIFLAGKYRREFEYQSLGDLPFEEVKRENIAQILNLSRPVYTLYDHMSILGNKYRFYLYKHEVSSEFYIVGRGGFGNYDLILYGPVRRDKLDFE